MVTKKTAAPAPAAKKAAAKKAPVANKAADVVKKAGAPVAAKKAGKALPTSEKPQEEPLGPPPAGLKVPKSLGAAADEMKRQEDEQSRLNRLASDAEAKRKWLKKWLIENLKKREDASGVAGALCRVKMVEKDVPRAENWSLIYQAIVSEYLALKKKSPGQEDAAFALLQRRLGDTHVKQLWDAKKVVPGVSKFTYTDLSVTQL
jgi:hypothetical protein